jgi:hypothetical protein
MLEEVLDIRNVKYALKQVTSNKGASGVDGMSLKEFKRLHQRPLPDI